MKSTELRNNSKTVKCPSIDLEIHISIKCSTWRPLNNYFSDHFFGCISIIRRGAPSLGVQPSSLGVQTEPHAPTSPDQRRWSWNKNLNINISIDSEGKSMRKHTISVHINISICLSSIQNQYAFDIYKPSQFKISAMYNKCGHKQI